MSVARLSMYRRLSSDSTRKKFVFSPLLSSPCIPPSLLPRTFPHIHDWKFSRSHSILTLLSPRLSVVAARDASRESVLRPPTRVARRKRRNKRLHLDLDLDLDPIPTPPPSPHWRSESGLWSVRMLCVPDCMQSYRQRNAIMLFHATRRV